MESKIEVNRFTISIHVKKSTNYPGTNLHPEINSLSCCSAYKRKEKESLWKDSVKMAD